MMTNLVQFPRLGLELEIDRVAFTLGGLNIYWYGIIIAAGLLLALVFAFHYAADFGVDADRLVDVVLVGTVCAIICARAYYVAWTTPCRPCFVPSEAPPWWWTPPEGRKGEIAYDDESGPVPPSGAGA